MLSRLVDTDSFYSFTFERAQLGFDWIQTFQVCLAIKLSRKLESNNCDKLTSISSHQSLNQVIQTIVKWQEKEIFWRVCDLCKSWNCLRNQQTAS